MMDINTHIEAVARALYGAPNPKLSTRSQLRFGTNGSLAVEIAGPKHGTWYNHEAKTGGSTLDLVSHKLGIANGAALEWLRSEIGIDDDRQKQRRAPNGRPVATYNYEDEDGNLLFQVVRYKPKTFKQRRPDGHGGWIWNVDGVRIVPYRLPSFAAGTGTIYIAEGEKDVEALCQMGFVATCNPMGAGKWPDYFAEYFAGRDVVILPDNDDAGRDHANKVTRNLTAVATNVRIVDLPGLPPKGDVSDWIRSGGTAAQLCALAATVKPWNSGNNGNFQSAGPKGFATAATFAAIMDAVFEPLRWTVPGYLPEGLAILAGRQKLGKTWIAIDFAISVGTGGAAFGNISCEQGDVLYIDLENGKRRLKRRLEMMFPYPPARPDLSRIKWIDRSPELGPEFIEACEGWRQSVEKPALIVVDVLQRIKPAGRVSRNSYENDYSALADLQQWATQNSVTVLVLYHTRKGGADDPLEALSGSNGLSACADTTLVLDRTAAGFALYVRGRDVEERETALKFDNGWWSILGDAEEWKRSGERSAILRVLKDADEPMAPAEIADAIGKRRGNVRRLLFEMAKTGEVQKRGRGLYIHPLRADPGNSGNNGNFQAESPGGPLTQPTEPKLSEPEVPGTSTEAPQPEPGLPKLLGEPMIGNLAEPRTQSISAHIESKVTVVTEVTGVSAADDHLLE